MTASILILQQSKLIIKSESHAFEVPFLRRRGGGVAGEDGTFFECEILTSASAFQRSSLGQNLCMHDQEPSEKHWQ